ncbi:hypothetical protein TRSC58_06952 [Trypanosoma rangeli SC58]|uniref:Conserved oligomeric Golgi complex subunit 7 n=1 Tax=Trypanosoma rangeli SC58 TaxID=429131 RepID=A0A061IU50_TRYRA|nr:hypothetical protein TRSC58_06952 [Trypanosoma rangeli SC58]
MSSARAAELLKGQLMPFIGHALSEQLDYVLRMAQSEDRATADPPQTEKHAEARAVKVMQLMVDEVVGSIGGALEPILERAERNEELMACCDAVRQLGLREDVGIHTTDAGSATGCGGSLREVIVRQISTYAFTELVGIFGKPNILEAFARREACRVEALLDDPKQALRRERFQAVMDAMMDAVKSILRFFPEKTLPMCVGKWREAILRTIAGLRPTPAAPQGSLLANLSTARSVGGQLLQGAARTSSEYLVSSEMQRLYPSLADTVNEQLRTQLWAPLTEALESCAVECQKAVKRTIIEPVVAKADGYELQLFWCSKQNGGDSFSSATPTVSYTPAQIAPSELVRSLGEAIVEIPLALEALRGNGDGDCHPNGIEDLLEEVAGDWLEDIVRAAVAEFIENKVGNITIYFPSDAPDAMKEGDRRRGAVGDGT